MNQKTLNIYISNWNSIGGVETFVQNFCKRMSKYFEINLIYDKADSTSQILELSKYCNITKLDKSKIYESDYFICSTAWGQSPFEFIKAKRVIQIIHADYRHVIANWNFKYIKNPSVTDHVAVGELVKESFEIATPYKIDKIIYNLLDNTIELPNKPNNKILNLITVSRLSGEKGFDRMVKLAQLLELNKIPYIWNIFGNVDNDYNKKIIAKFKDFKSVKFNGVIRNPFPEINKADYLVQLSDTEGFAYSVYESLQIKTPCIITPFASGNEQIQHGINGYIIPFDLTDIDFNEIINNIPTIKEFKEVGSENVWLEFLNEPNLKPINKRVNRTANVFATQKYFDIELNRHIAKKEALNVTIPRMKQLIDNNVCELIQIT